MALTDLKSNLSHIRAIKQTPEKKLGDVSNATPTPQKTVGDIKPIPPIPPKPLGQIKDLQPTPTKRLGEVIDISPTPKKTLSNINELQSTPNKPLGNIIKEITSTEKTLGGIQPLQTTPKKPLGNTIPLSETPDKPLKNLKEVNFITNTNAKGFSINRQPKDKTDFLIGSQRKDNFLDRKGDRVVKFSDTEPYSIGGQRNSDIIQQQAPTLDNLYSRAKKDNDALGLRKSKFGSRQPFIIRDVGQRWNGLDKPYVGNTIDIVRGGPLTLLGRAAADTERIAKFLSTTPGAIFLGKQALLQILNPFDNTKIYDPASNFSNGYIRLQRHFSPLSALGQAIGIGSKYIDKVKQSQVGQAIGDKVAGLKSNLAKRGSNAVANTGLPDGLKNKIDSALLAEIYRNKNYKRFSKLGDPATPNLPEKNIDGGQNIKGGRKSANVDKLNMHPYGGLLSDINVNNNNDDFIPFKFRDLVNGKWIIFRAILSGISDNIQPEYASERYVGRPDNVYVYQGTNREINFTFQIYPNTKQELYVLWDKINYLSGLCYPTFKENNPGLSMVSPFVGLTIGDMYNNTPGYISSLNINVLDDTTWEMDDGIKLPKHLECAVGFTYIGKHLQSTTGKHFDLGWLNNPEGDGIGTFTQYSDGTSIAEQPGPNRAPFESSIFPSNRPKRPILPPDPPDVDLDILDDAELDPIRG